MNDTDREERFAQLLDGNRARLLTISRLYGNGRDAADLYQEILLQLWRSLSAFEARSALDTWVYRVALNTALSWRRRARRRWDREDPRGVVPEIGAPGPGDPLAVLEDFLGKLAPMDRAVLLLYLDGLSHAQTASVTGLSEGAVAVRLSRLKAAFERDYVGR
jgi:RNA polymerase sigma-70 factor, ECF subfamily